MGFDGPIGKAGLSWNTHAFVHYTILPSLSVRGMAGNGREQTDRYSTRHRSKWAGVMGTYDLPLGFSVTAAQQLFLTNFWQPNFLFGRNPPCGRWLRPRVLTPVSSGIPLETGVRLPAHRFLALSVSSRWR